MASELEQIDSDIEGYLARHEQKELCRFVAVGSVDDGKSTLIGRLLHDTLGVYEDQLQAVRRATAAKKGGAADDAGGDEEIDFSLFTDGLKAEREQGITIDVAYRYFSTANRKFIIADTPGHVQYTRNMATGASTADVAIILLDARLGVLPQSRRHAYIASLLRIPHLLVAVNNMDLVAWSEATFYRLREEFGAFAARLDFSTVCFFPISAKLGDNVVHPSRRTPWFDGGTLLGHLETVAVGRDRGAERFRFPVQIVLRPHLDYRGFAGPIASGVVHPGDEVVALPSGRRTRIKAIDVWEGELAEAAAPLSVALRLEDEVDVSRGDMLVRPGELPLLARRFDATLVWLAEQPFDPSRSLLLKHTTRQVPARVERIHHRLDLETLEPAVASGLHLNDIGRVTIRCARPLFCDPYLDNRATGAFILVDALGNGTVAAGMILGEEGEGEATSRGPVTTAEREARLGQRGAILWLPAGSEAAHAVERQLHDRGLVAAVVAAVELDEASLIQVAVHLAAAGLAVIVAGGSAAALDQVTLRFGPPRVVTMADSTVDVAAAVARLAERCAPSGD